jgi:hypothetical protein
MRRCSPSSTTIWTSRTRKSDGAALRMARAAVSRAGLVGAWLLKGYGEEGDQETLGRKRSPVSSCPAPPTP